MVWRVAAGCGALWLSLCTAGAVAAQRLPAAADQPKGVAANPAHEWLLYLAIALGAVNLVLLYLLNRNRTAPVAASTDAADSGHSSSRTDRRMDKRKREIDDLRQQLELLNERVGVETAKRLTPAQVQELVRTFVHDELTRSALPDDSSSR